MKISINQIGSFAQQVLERSESALITGIASRGIYLQPKGDWTLYISQENFRGPLTLNLAEGSYRLEKIKAGHSAQFSPGEIHFPDSEIIISLEGAKIWHPHKIDSKTNDLPGDLEPVLALASKIAPENPYLPLLSRNPQEIPGVQVIGDRIHKLQKSLIARDPELMANQAIKLLGLGPGLTPLGDDFLLGVVLTLNRWGHILDPQKPGQERNSSSDQDFNMTESLNQIIQENSHVKTTRISASLLDCAMEGAADERLLAVLDGLFSGTPIAQSDLRNMLRWGNSSGITVLAGIISVLKTKDMIS
jgi:hypothetical protein